MVYGSEPEDSHEVFFSCLAFERFLHVPGEKSCSTVDEILKMSRG